MRSCPPLLAAALLLGGFLPAAGQTTSGSALVVDIPADSFYHTPGCSLVRKAGSAVKVMKQSEAVRRGLKPHDCDSASAAADAAAAAEAANAAPVYVQKNDKRYHKAGCEKLGDAASTIALDDAGQKYWPCPVCKPPVRKRAK
jgi:hypothetical protein